MAFLSVKNVRIAGISAGVPLRKINNLDIQDLSADYDAKDFVEVTGVLERRVDDYTTSDLCLSAVCLPNHRFHFTRNSLYHTGQARLKQRMLC